MLRVGTAAFNCTAKVSETLLALAVNVTVCAVLTKEIVAEKLALVAPAATVIEDGTVTAELFLARLTENPPLAAAALSPTVQASVPAPVIELLLQESELSAAGTAVPVPLRAMMVEAPVEELLARASCPVTAPAVVGSNWIVRAADWLGLSVSGNATPVIEKPAPVTAPELMVTAAVPVEVKITDCAVAVFTVTLPKLMVDVLILSTGRAAFNCIVNVLETPLALPVSVADCVVDTEETVAEKPAVVAPAAMVTEDGTATEELLLDRLTANPPFGAAALRITVQASVPDPVMELLLQERADGVTGAPPDPEGVRKATACMIHGWAPLVGAEAV
jgi:hypothetical protein